MGFLNRKGKRSDSAKKVFLSIFVLLTVFLLTGLAFASSEIQDSVDENSFKTTKATTVEYYFQPSCGSCKDVEVIITDLEKRYTDVKFEKYDITVASNYEKMQERGGALTPYVYCNGFGFGDLGIKDGSLEKSILGTYIPPKENVTDSNINPNITEKFDFLKKFGAIGNYLNEKINESRYLFAYAFGIISGLSTCFVAMVGFIFVYTADAESKESNEEKYTGMKKKIMEVSKILYRLLVFSAGLITCYLIIGYTFILFKTTIANLSIISYIVGTVVILIGLNMMGILKVPIDTGEKFKEFARKYVSSTPGLFLIGCLFSFVKVPCTFPFLIILIDKTVVTGSFADLLMLFVFCLGVVTPLIVLGSLGSYAVTKSIRKYRKEIKIVSGIILIILGSWVMFY